MSAEKRRYYLANIEPLWAEEALRDRGGSLTPDSVRVLTMIATCGDKRAAAAAWQRAKDAEQEARCMGGL